jgi:hypothetical protein
MDYLVGLKKILTKDVAEFSLGFSKGVPLDKPRASTVEGEASRCISGLGLLHTSKIVNENESQQLTIWNWQAF